MYQILQQASVVVVVAFGEFVRNVSAEAARSVAAGSVVHVTEAAFHHEDHWRVAKQVQALK